jgi:hypothetical protein
LHTARLRSPALFLSAALAGALVLEGCSSSSGGGSGLPAASSATPVATPSVTASGSILSGLAGLTPPQRQVVDNVTTYDALVQSYLSGAKVSLAKTLAVAVEPWATTLTESAGVSQSQGRVKGSVLRRVVTVQVAGGTAIESECLDTRHQTFYPVHGAAQPQDFVSPKLGIITLVQASGSWKVKTVKRGAAC